MGSLKKRIRAILRGGIDFALQSRNGNEIRLEHCGGAPQSSFDVNAIPDRTRVTLVRGNTRMSVVVREPVGTFECNYNGFTAGSNVAQRLRLMNGARYSFTYDDVNKVIQIRRKPVSTERVRVVPDPAYTVNQIGLGDGLKPWLGYYLPERTAISVRGGSARKQLRVRTIRAGFNELFRYEIRLNPQNFRLFGLGNRPGAFFVSYDQISRILRLGSRTVLKKKMSSRKLKK